MKTNNWSFGVTTFMEKKWNVSNSVPFLDWHQSDHSLQAPTFSVFALRSLDLHPAGSWANLMQFLFGMQTHQIFSNDGRNKRDVLVSMLISIKVITHKDVKRYAQMASLVASETCIFVFFFTLKNISSPVWSLTRKVMVSLPASSAPSAIANDYESELICKNGKESATIARPKID